MYIMDSFGWLITICSIMGVMWIFIIIINVLKCACQEAKGEKVTKIYNAVKVLGIIFAIVTTSWVFSIIMFFVSMFRR